MRNLIYKFLVFILLLAGGFYTTTDYKVLSYGLLGLSIVLMVCALLVVAVTGGITRVRIKGGVLMMFWFAALISMVVSSLVNFSYEIFAGALLLLLTYVFMSVFPVRIPAYQALGVPIICSFVVITIVCIVHGFSVPFIGAFHNQNSLGGFYATTAALSIGVYKDKVVYEARRSYVLLLCAGVSIAFSLLSFSRASFAVAAGTSFLVFVLGFIYRVDKTSFTASKLFVRGVIVLPLGIILFIFSWPFIEDIFLHKFMSKVDVGAVSNGRVEIWSVILENAKFFGYGRDGVHLDSLGLGAHSTFFSIMDTFGLISFFLFSIAVLYSLLSFLKRKYVLSFGVVPVVTAVCFIGLSLAESMINKTAMFSFMVVLNMHAGRSAAGFCRGVARAVCYSAPAGR